jgi:hypothetical protein
MQEYDISLWLLLLAVLLLPVDVGLRRLVVSRRELATILEAVPLRRRASPDGQSASPLIGAVRQRRLQRELVTQEAASTAPRAATVAPAAQPAARQRSASRPVTRTATAAGAAGGEERRDQPDEQSLAGRILAARRRKE